MSTDAKRAGNARYLAKLKTITVRMRPETAANVRQAADAAGESLNAYIVGAVAQRMDRDASAPQSGKGDLSPEVEHMLE